MDLLIPIIFPVICVCLGYYLGKHQHQQQPPRKFSGKRGDLYTFMPRRDYVATHIMAGLTSRGSNSHRHNALTALAAANALITEIDRERRRFDNEKTIQNKNPKQKENETQEINEKN